MGAVGDATTGAVFGAAVVPDGVVNGLIVPVGPVIGMELGAVAGVMTSEISVGVATGDDPGDSGPTILVSKFPSRSYTCYLLPDGLY